MQNQNSVSSLMLFLSELIEKATSVSICLAGMCSSGFSGFLSPELLNLRVNVSLGQELG